MARPGSGRRRATADLRVIGAGFGRTGTLSLKVALEELGFGPCEHTTEGPPGTVLPFRSP